MKNYIAELIGTFALVFCGTGDGICSLLSWKAVEDGPLPNGYADMLRKKV